MNARVYPSKVLSYLIGGQNYHLVHHLWPAVPWYNYEPVYQAMKPVLDEKGCRQTLGILTEDPASFWYDVFIGIRLPHPKSEPLLEVSAETIAQLEAAIEIDREPVLK